MNYLKSWLPSRGNVLFTLVIAASLIFYVHSVGAFPGVSQPKAPEVVTSTGTIAYQGRLFSASGVPLNSSYPMTFTFYNVPIGGVGLWTETRPSVSVSDGLFNVLLGSVTPITQSIITGNNSLWLGVQIGGDPEMTPRVQLGSAPFAMQSLVVPSGAITTTMIADGAVTRTKAPFALQSYWGTAPTNDVKLMNFTTVVTLQSSPNAQSFDYDISALGLTDIPIAVCQMVSGNSDVFCHADWDGSTTTSLKIWILRYNNGPLGAGNLRINVILLGR